MSEWLVEQCCTKAAREAQKYEDLTVASLKTRTAIQPLLTIIDRQFAALRSANSRLAEANHQCVLADKKLETQHRLIANQARDLRAAEARVAELEKALEPFAELAGGFDAHIYNDEKWPLLFKDEDHPVDDRGPTIGDLRRARSTLSTGAGEEKR
jgi:hypothetical protein